MTKHSREDEGATQHWQLFAAVAARYLALDWSWQCSTMLCKSLVQGSDSPEPRSLLHFLLVQLLASL